jgi:hypothetical protein
MIAAFRPLLLRTTVLLLDATSSSESRAGDAEDLGWECEEDSKSYVLGNYGIFITVYDQYLFIIHQTVKGSLQQVKHVGHG